MKKVALALSIALAASVTATQALAFGLPKLPGIPGVPLLGGGGASVDVQGFINQASETNKLFQDSAATLAEAIADKATVAELQNLKATLEGTADPKEKEAIIQKIQSTTQAALTAAGEDQAAAAERLKSVEAEQLGKYLDAAKNFAKGALMAAELAPAGQSALASIQSNPLQATKLLGLKRTIGDISGIVSNSSLALTKVPGIFKQANIPLTLPTTGKGTVAEAN